MKIKLLLATFVLGIFVPIFALAGSYPVGTFDSVDNNLCQVSGWAKDPDSTSPINIHIYKDGNFSQGIFVKSVLADLLRSDLPYTDKNHGFVYKFESNSGLYDNQDHQIYIYGIDATGDSNVDLNSSPKTIHCPVSTSGLASVNIKDYGAKGDGITDDSMAIQNAIQALATAGGTINIPAGTYMLGTSSGGVQNFPNGQPIQSAIIINKDNVKFIGTGGPVFKLMANRKMRAISVTGKNAIIDGITVDGNKSQRNGTLPWPNADVVDGLVYFDTTASGGTIKNCEVRNGIEDGIGFWQSADALVENCYSHDNGTPQAGASGISLSGGPRAKATNNRSENNTIGLWSAFGSQNVNIQNNILKNNKQEGIIIGGFTTENGRGNNSGFTISGNTIEGNGVNAFAALSIASASNGTISNNYIINNYFDGLQISDEGTLPSTGWTIQNNTCSNTTTARLQNFGIRILGLSSNITLTGNTCQNNGSSINDQIVVQTASAVNANWQTTNTVSYSSSTTLPPPTPTPTPTSTPTSTSTNSTSLINDSGTFYIVQNNQKQGITNPDMLYTYGLEFKDAIPATVADLALPTGNLLLPANGSLVKSSLDPTVYLISQGKKQGFISAEVFTALGFKFSSVLTVTAPELNQLPLGSVISDSTLPHPDGFNINQDGTIYWIHNQTKHGYPSLEVYNSWNLDNDFSRIVPANSADRALPIGDVVSLRRIE